jgi:cell division protein FtsW
MSEATVDRTGRANASRRVEELLSHPHAFRYLVLVPSLMLLIIGMVMVVSASMVRSIDRWHGDPFHFSLRQAAFLVAGLVFAALVYLLFAKCSLRTVHLVGLAFLLAVFLLELLTFVPGIGHSMGGNRNWVRLIGDQGIQPAEFGKLALMWWGASVFAVKSEGRRNLLNRPMHLMVPFLVVGGLFTAMVVVQRDLGTGIVLAATLLLMLWVVGAPMRVMAVVVAVVGAMAFGYIVTDEHRLSRLTAYFNPGTDMAGANFQGGQAAVAFARGGWFGVGLNASRQKWLGLPEAHTDYILAVTGEELGLICVLLVVALFAVLCFAGFQIALRSDIPLFKFAAGGVTSWLAVATLCNIGVELGILPVFGVPLPLLSYGGSALLAVMGGVGVLLGCAAQLPVARNYRKNDWQQATVFEK